MGDNRLRKALRASPWDTLFVPVFALKEPATNEDVAAGRAIFELGGKGRIEARELPATAIVKKDAGQKDPPRVLIAQAESDERGVVHYGIITRPEIKAVAADELEDIRPVVKED